MAHPSTRLGPLSGGVSRPARLWSILDVLATPVCSGDRLRMETIEQIGRDIFG